MEKVLRKRKTLASLLPIYRAECFFVSNSAAFAKESVVPLQLSPLRPVAEIQRVPDFRNIRPSGTASAGVTE
jgi:hypothetical protein